VRFGLFYEHQLPRPWDSGAEHQLLQDALAQIELADRVGFEYVWAVEHHFLEEYSHSSAPEVFLAAASQRTKKIRLGHGILQTSPLYNHPARSAERLATLDLVSGGRVEFGSGESTTTMELGGFNIPFAEKQAQWSEGLEAVIRCLTEEPFTGMDGRWVQMPPRNVVPKPLQRPHPPLWVACSRRDTIVRAAESGLGALTFAFIDPEEARGWVQAYERHLEKCRPLGLRVDPEVACVTPMMVHRDEREALRRGLEGGNFFGYSLAYYIVFGDHVPGRSDLWRDFHEKRREKGYDPAVALAERQQKLGARIAAGDNSALRGAVGTPAQLRDYLRRYEEAGVDQLIFVLQAGRNRHEHIMEALELFGREVLPEFAERDAAQRAAKAERLRPLVEAALARRESRAPALPAGFHVPAIAKALYEKTGGSELLKKIEEDTALGVADLGGPPAAPPPAPAGAPPGARPKPNGPLPTQPQAFLSDAWFEMVEALRAAIDPPIPDAVRNLRMNVRVLAGPRGDVEARIVGGQFQRGSAPGAPVTMMVPFDLARKMLVENDGAAAMQAMMQGQIKIEGDIAVLMALQQGGPPTPESEHLQERIRALTR